MDMAKTMILHRYLMCIVLVLTTVACRQENDEKLSRRIVSRIESGTSLDLQSVAAFDWDTVYIVTPYTPQAWSKREFNGEYAKIEHYEMDLQDRVYLFVFMDSGEIVRLAEVGTGVMSFEPRMGQAFGRAEAVFRVEPWNDLRLLKPE